MLALLRIAQRTVAGPATPSSPVAAVDFYIKVGMTTSLIQRIEGPDGIATTAIAKFLGSDVAMQKTHPHSLVSKALDETCDGNGVTCVGFSVFLGLIRSDVSSAEERRSDGFERCVYEIVAQTIKDKKETISNISSGNIEVQLDESAHTCDSGLCYIGAGDTDPRVACFNTLTNHLIDACENLETHHTEHPSGSKTDHAVARLRWQGAARTIVM
jgi:hypothetical protein